MNYPLFIPVVLLIALAIFSLLVGTHRIAAAGVIFWNFILFVMMDTLYSVSSRGSLMGVFFVLTLSLIMSFIFLGQYQKESKKILLKLSTVSAAFCLANLLCIMTYIKPIREMWWYHSPSFDFFYWHYGELQIVLTLYMITLFGKSGIMGLSNGFNATRKYFINVRNMHDGLAGNSNSHCKEVAQASKIYKKGI